MKYDGTSVNAPSASRRKIMPPTPQQSLQPSNEAMQLQTGGEDEESGSGAMEYEGEYRWSARDRRAIARMEQHLNENDNMRVEIEELHRAKVPFKKFSGNGESDTWEAMIGKKSG